MLVAAVLCCLMAACYVGRVLRVSNFNDCIQDLAHALFFLLTGFMLALFSLFGKLAR